MTIEERALVFHCGDDALVGVVCAPASPGPIGVIIVVGGPQYRAGSHRQFVLLARSLAAAGHAVLRFDVRGMGDAGGAQRSFETVDDDIAMAIDALQACVPAMRRVVLWGLCDAASAALMYWGRTRDARVAGLCLANPWVRSPASEARTQLRHYYAQRLAQPDFWRKMLRGDGLASAAAGLLRNGRIAALGQRDPQVDAARPFQHLMAEAWAAFPHDILLLLSGNDYTAKEFLDVARTDPAWAHALRRPRLSRHDLPAADHTFPDAASRRLVERLTAQWIADLGEAAGAQPALAQAQEAPW